MKEIVFVKKSDVSKGLKESEVINIFENSDDLEQIKNAVENSDSRLYATWISVDVKDNANERIPIEDVIREQNILLERNGPISDTHTNKIVGRTLAYKVLEHPEAKKIGVLHLEKIYDHNPADDKVWNEIVTGERTGSSVGGINTNVSLEKDENGRPTTVLQGFSHMETASVMKPCNPFATNVAYSVVAKSQSYENEKEKEKKTEINQETVINKQNEINDTDKFKGDKMENDEVKKSISDLTEVVKALVSKVDKLEEEMPKADVEGDKKPAEEKPAADKKVEKEDAKSDIEGENDAIAPASPTPDSSNDKDVFKKDIADLAKSVKELKTLVVAKVSTPAPAAEVKKSNSLAYEIATGQKKMTYLEVHKAHRDAKGVSNE